MTEIVTSVVVQEAVSQALSTIKERYEGRSEEEEYMERMEMAHIKLEAALETSDKWNISSVPLLRWRSKLKRAAQECDDTLRSCKQRLEEEEEAAHQIRSSSFPRRISHSTRLFVTSIFNIRDNKEPSRSTVRRFEWFAEGASEFLRHVESGGTPCRCLFSDPLLRHLLAGKGTNYCLSIGRQHITFMVRPLVLDEHGIQARLNFSLEDSDAPENNFLLGIHFELSESTDTVGVIVRCVHLFTPHLKSTVETVKTKLTQLPMQDFFWVPNCSLGAQKEHWDNLQTIIYQCFRPNTLRSQQQTHQHVTSYSASNTNSLSGSFQGDIYLDPVTVVYFQGHVTMSARHNKRTTAVKEGTWPTRNFSFLKLAGIFTPHASSEDLSPIVGCSATDVINGETSQYANISFEQLGEIMLPKAVDCLFGHDADTHYQMLWKSKHASSYFRIEETSCQATYRKCRGGKRQKWWGNKEQGWTSGIGEFMSSWVVYTPVQLKGLLVDWIQKEKQNQIQLLGEEETPC